MHLISDTAFLLVKKKKTVLGAEERRGALGMGINQCKGWFQFTTGKA